MIGFYPSMRMKRCSPDAQNEILGILGSSASADAYFIPRREYFYGAKK